MRYIFMILSTALVLSSCSFINDDTVQDTSAISVHTFLDTLSREGTGGVIPDSTSGQTTTMSSVGELQPTGTGAIQTHFLPPSKAPTNTGSTSIESSGGLDTSTGASDQEIEGLINSLFDNL